MKCPKCGNALRISKKDEHFALCDHCRKKFRIPESMLKKASEEEKEAPAPKKAEPEVQTEASAPASDAVTSVSASEPDEDLTGATQVFSRREVRAALKKQNALRKAEASAAKKTAKETSVSYEEDDHDFHFKYANIPPKEIREKQEREMRQAYDELLSIGKEERANKKRGFFGRKK